MSRLLPVTPRPFEDESFPGYLLRLSEVNGYRAPNRLAWRINAGERRNKMHTGFTSLDLASVTGHAPSVFEGLVRRDANGPKERQAVGVIDRSRAGRSLKAPMICALCIRANGYIHRIWDVAYVTACPVHHTSGVEVCASCGATLGWLRRRLGECDCGAEFTSAPGVADCAATAMAELVYSCLSSAAATQCTVAEAHGFPVQSLAALEPYPLLRLFDMLIAFSARMGGESPGHGKMAAASDVAARLLTHWPDNFVALLEKFRSAHGAKALSDALFVGSSALFSPVSKVDPRLHAALRLLADPVYEYINSGAPMYVHPRICKSVFAGKAFRWTTGHRFSVQHGVCSRRLSQLEQQGQIDVERTQGHVRVLVESIGGAGDIERSLQRVKVRTVARRWSMPSWLCKWILNADLVEDAWHYEGKAVPERVIAKIEARIERLVATARLTSPPGRTLTLRSLIASSRITREYKEKMLLEVFSGEVALYASGGEHFLDLALMDEDRSSGLAHQPWADGPNGWVPANVAADVIWCGKPTMVGMVDAGLIKGRRIGRMRQVEIKSLKRYATKYISIGEISSTSGLSTTAALRRMTSAFPECRPTAISISRRAGTKVYPRAKLPAPLPFYAKLLSF